MSAFRDFPWKIQYKTESSDWLESGTFPGRFPTLDAAKQYLDFAEVAQPRWFDLIQYRVVNELEPEPTQWYIEIYDNYGDGTGKWVPSAFRPDGYPSKAEALLDYAELHERHESTLAYRAVLA